ncbi:MAG: peptidylprolyl isomerase [Ruminococcus sp.]|nr:peptidylprolyl isomerase [Ruminococcus sp.]
MYQKKSLVKTVLVFTLIMSLGVLIFMIFSSFMKAKNSIVINTDTMELVQLEAPEEGDPIAIVETSLGEFRFVLYPEYSPNAVKNFTELAESGYYNNTYVFHSESGAFSAAGSPNKDGTLKEDFDKNRELVERELHQNLWPFKGAVCCMTSTVDKGFFDALFGGGDYYCGSRLAFLNTIEFTDEIKEEMASSDNKTLADAFAEKGGVPNFSQQMTVIGQTYEGMEIVEQLSKLETDASENGTYKIPKEDIMILSVTIDEYYESGEAAEESSDK